MAKQDTVFNSETDARAGFIIITVLWGVLTLAVLAIFIGQTVRSQISSASLQSTQLRRSLVAESALNRVLFALVAKNDPLSKKLVSDGRPLAWKFDGTITQISIEPESGKLDLNAAEVDVIAHVLKKLYGNRHGEKISYDIRQNRLIGRTFHTLNVIGRPTLPVGSATPE
jgi:hypothetical protein